MLLYASLLLIWHFQNLTSDKRSSQEDVVQAARKVACSICDRRIPAEASIELPGQPHN